MNDVIHSPRFEIAAQVATLTSMSPLLGQWASRVVEDVTIPDRILRALSNSGFDLASWVGVRKMFTACVTVASLHDTALTQFIPTLGGIEDSGAEFILALKDVLSSHLREVMALSDRMLVSNDPLTGIDMWSAAQRQIPSGVELLVVGAGAGLELIADHLDVRLTWRPSTRLGVDIHPINVRDELSARWLLAVCPPDDVLRASRTRQAIGIVKEQDIRVLADDAVEYLVAHPPLPLVVMGASVLCMFDDPTRFIETVRKRTCDTWLVTQEVVSVHRKSGLGAGLEKRSAGDIVTRVVHFKNDSMTILS